MAPRTPSASDTAGLRRRVIVELTPQELPLLDRAERQAGSKRAAVVAGLRALEHASETAARIEAAERERDEARTAARAGARTEPASSRRAREEAEAARADAERERDAACAQLDEVLVRAEEDRASFEQEVAVCEEEIRTLRARQPSALYCARCDGWAPEVEWAWQEGADEREHAYHRPCGDRGPGLLGASSWLALREG